MAIRIEHLTHTYMPGSPFSATAIHDLTLTIEDGEFIGILGHTGSGKTTFVQHLNGLLKPTEGSVWIDDLDITRKGVSLLTVRRKVGLVFQYPEYQLFEETVAKDVAFGPKNMGLSKEEIEERVHVALRQVGLNDTEVWESSPFELSGGQMRRVAIAGVLAMRPETLILDEPTAGLDPSGRRSILDMIRRLHAETGMTVLMVSHSMDDIAMLATRLIVMSKGELVMTGTPREVFRQREILRAIGLGVPQGAELCYRLRKEGFALPEDLYTLEEVRDALLKLAGLPVPNVPGMPDAARVQTTGVPGTVLPHGLEPTPDAAQPASDGASATSVKPSPDGASATSAQPSPDGASATSVKPSPDGASAKGANA